MLLQLLLSLDASFVEREIVEVKWGLSEKPLNLMRETGEKNRETTENILSL